MKWIKCSEKMPEKDGQYFFRGKEGRGLTYFLANNAENKGLDQDEEWLDETQNDDSDAEKAFLAAREKVEQPTMRESFWHNKYTDYAHYKSQQLENQSTSL